MNVLQGLTGILGFSGKSSQTHGAGDVIVIEQSSTKTTQQSASDSSVLDGAEQQQTVTSLASTPWHVRFASSANTAVAGDTRRPIVTLRVNGNETHVRMRVGHAGEAYFLRDVVEGEAARLGSELFSDTNDEESDWSDSSADSSSNDDADNQQTLQAADEKSNNMPALDVAADAAESANGHESDGDSKDENIATTAAASWSWKYGHLPHQRRKRSQPRPLILDALHNQVSLDPHV
jgi:phosphatidate phosphatase PAH1